MTPYLGNDNPFFNGRKETPDFGFKHHVRHGQTVLGVPWGRCSCRDGEYGLCPGGVTMFRVCRLLGGPATNGGFPYWFPSKTTQVNTVRNVTVCSVYLGCGPS